MRRPSGDSGFGSFLVRGAGVSLVLQVCAVGLGFGVNLVLARSLGPGDYGIYVYVLSWLTLLLLFSGAGVGNNAVRIVASLAGSGRWEHLRGFLRASCFSVTATSLVVAALASALAWSLRGFLAPDLLHVLLAGFCAIPVYSMMELWAYSLRGLGSIVASQLGARIIAPSILLVSFGVLWVLGRELRATDAIWLYFASGVLGLLCVGLLLRTATPRDVRAARPLYEAHDWWWGSLPYLVVNGFFVILGSTDTLLLGSLRSTTDAGLYAPALRVASVAVFGLSAVNFWAGPMIADLHARGQREDLDRLLKRAALVGFAFTLPIAAGVVALSSPILGLFGPEFLAARSSLFILMVGNLVNAACGPVGTVLAMTGNQPMAARILGFYAVVNIVANGLLIPRFGLEGAAFATALSTAGWNLHMMVAIRLRLGLRTTVV